VVNLLAWIGGQGTRAIAALVVIGITMPWLGTLLKPFVPEAIFVVLCISFLRLEHAAFKRYLRRPALVIGATVWTAFAVPALVGMGCVALGLRESAPELFLALMLQAIASPMMAAPALAAMMGLDATLVLATLISSTALIPFTAALFAEAFVGPALLSSSVALGVKLLAMLAGSALVGLVLRKLVGPVRIEQYKQPIDGVNILVLLVFVAGLMENVAPSLLAKPLFTLGLCALAFFAFFLMLCLTTLLFIYTGWEKALSLGFMASQRNTGLMVAATSGALPELAWLYFGLGQFPIYLSPLLLKPLVRRVLPAAPQTSST
jgi:hypothetical protein